MVMQGLIWLFGPVLEAVQEAALFEDSKTFVYALNAPHTTRGVLLRSTCFPIGEANAIRKVVLVAKSMSGMLSGICRYK